jgi:succinate dehydrogenase flavin-adding protein (antitoxin of CptAB toxin-antitoxin module)
MQAFFSDFPTAHEMSQMDDDQKVQFLDLIYSKKKDIVAVFITKQVCTLASLK